MHPASQWWSVMGLALAALAGWQLRRCLGGRERGRRRGTAESLLCLLCGHRHRRRNPALSKPNSNWPRCWQNWVTRGWPTSGSVERWRCSRPWRSTTRSCSRCTPISWSTPAIAATTRSSRTYPKAQRAWHASCGWWSTAGSTSRRRPRVTSVLSHCCGKSPTSRSSSGVAVSLYPHKGCYAQRMEDVVRLAKKTDRPNVGVTFTFCHFLAVDDAKNLDRVLKMARPYLTMVTINGTSGYGSGNLASWIQVLGEGTFDVGAVLKALRKLDYRGPIGIIAYGIKGDRREILSRSIQAWKKLSAEAVGR